MTEHHDRPERGVLGDAGAKFVAAVGVDGGAQGEAREGGAGVAFLDGAGEAEGRGIDPPDVSM